MQLGKILGTVTSTVKHSSMNGWRLVVAQFLMADGQSHDGEPIVAVDSLGSRLGDVVILSSDGRGTRELLGSSTTPVRWCVIGLRDP